MHTPSTRIMSTLAYDCGREYDPTDPLCQALAEAVMHSEHAMHIVGEDGPFEKARRRRRERERERAAIPEWFSAQDLIAAPWEAAEQRFVRDQPASLGITAGPAV